MKPIDLRNATWADIQERLTGDRMDVHTDLARRGPLTTRQLARAMERDILMVRPRVTELCQLGLVRLSGRDGNEGVYEAIPLGEYRRMMEERPHDDTEQQQFGF